MYSLAWAQTRVSEYMKSHTRATNFLMTFTGIRVNRLVFFLASGDGRWEAFKYVVRNLENGLNIRRTPNTTIHLDSKKALSITLAIVKRSDSYTPAYLLTALKEWRTLIQHVCDTRACASDSDSFDFIPDEGQLEITFEGGGNDPT